MQYLSGGIGHKVMHDLAPPTPVQDFAMEDDEQLRENDNGAEDEDMDGVEAMGILEVARMILRVVGVHRVMGRRVTMGTRMKKTLRLMRRWTARWKRLTSSPMTSLMASQTCNSSQYYLKKHNTEIKYCEIVHSNTFLRVLWNQKLQELLHQLGIEHRISGIGHTTCYTQKAAH